MFFLEKLFSQCFFTKNDESSNESISKDFEKESNYKEDRKDRKTSYFNGLVHMFRATVGTGILGLPIAFSQSGYVLGIIGTLFVTYLSLHLALVLARSQLKQQLKDSTVATTFKGAVEAGFAQGPEKLKWTAPFFVKSTNIVLLIGQTGGVCVYFLFIAANLKAVVDPYLELDLRLWTAIISVPILAMNLVISLRQLALVSGAGNVIVLLSTGIIFYYILREPLSLEGRQEFGEVRDLPRFFGTVFFANAYINMVMPLQSEMARPELVSRRFGVLDMNALITGALYTAFGFLGYLRYGDDARDSVTLNLPGEKIGRTVQLLLAVSVMTAAALQNYISMSIIWEDYLDKKMSENKNVHKYLLPTLIVLITLIISITIPKLELLVAVTGILGQIFINTALPCLIHYLTFYEQDTYWAFIKEFWMDGVAILFSIFILISSGNSLILDLREFFN